MSVFRGSISEYPGVIVDHFISANCERGRVFFLSHCHRDHMTGLGSPNIVAALKKWSTNLLCSDVTQSLLLKDPEFTGLAPYLRALPMEEPIVMNLQPSGAHEKLSFTVTLLPAGHCPGSSMFFFQGDKGNVLYTGDFRLTLEETKRLRPLHCGGSLLEISSLYVDTTFCHPIATEIPSRDTSRDIILTLVERWLAKDPTNVVHLQCASFGYEHIFMAIHNKFKTKIHIAPWKMNAYREISAVADCLTTSGDSTNIHTCTYQKGQKEKKEKSGLPCGSCQRNGTPPNVLRIKPSTQWFLFNRKSTTHPCVFLPQSNKFRVIHSMHASFSELKDFITYVRPRRIVPCVIPFGDASLSDVCARLKGLLPQTEVGSGCVVESEKKQRKRLKRSHSQKKSAEDAATEAPESSEDSWSTGDESIDEFTSTGEPASSVETEMTVFVHTQTRDTHLSLPSLIGVEDDTRSSPPPSGDSSATLGTLVQSPIDLSLSPSLQSLTSSQSFARAITNTSSATNVSNIPSSQPTVKQSQNLPEIEVPNFHNRGSEFECAGEGNDSLCEVGTPHSKRIRLSEESFPVSRKLFTGTAADCKQVARDDKEEEADSEQVAKDDVKDKDEEGEEEDKEVNDDEEDSIEVEDINSPSTPLLIDLTEDDEDDTLVSPVPPELIDLTDDQLTPPPQEPLSKKLSDSQTSGSMSSGCSARRQRSVSVESTSRALGSPNCLPPTPGRENVHSILQRPDFP